MELKLALVLLCSVAVNAEPLETLAPPPEPPCCYKKTYGDGSEYTLVESGSTEVSEYRCDTAGDCIYMKDGTSDRYCFKMGGVEVPGCEEKPCDEYLIKAGTTFSTQELDVTGTCKLPTFDFPTDGVATSITQAGTDLYMLAGKSVKVPMKARANGTWEAFPASSPQFPTDKYALTYSKSRGLLAVGGEKGGQTRDSIYQLQMHLDGPGWTQMSFNLDKAVVMDRGAAFVSDDDSKLLTVGGQSHPKINVYNLADGSLFATTGLKTDRVWWSVYIYDVVTFEDGNNEFYSYDLNKGELTKLPHPEISGGKLINFRGKPTYVGGMEKSTNELSTDALVYEDDSWELLRPVDTSDFSPYWFMLYVNKQGV